MSLYLPFFCILVLLLSGDDALTLTASSLLFFHKHAPKVLSAVIVW